MAAIDAKDKKKVPFQPSMIVFTPTGLNILIQKQIHFI
jgi:hypothetical protein